MATKITCPKCGEPKACAVYEDGHQYCFNPACGHRTPPTIGPDAVPDRKPRPKALKDALPVDMERSVGRAISVPTMKRYGYGTSRFSGKPVDVWNLYNQAGEVVQQKVRFTDHKDFTVLSLVDDAPEAHECQLWGMHVWGDQHDKRVVVTEGEYDAMSVAQAAAFKYPVVSINAGADAAYKCLKANYRWLDRFEEIILWFDNDAAGADALDKCASLFATGKVKVAKIDGIKDANEALQAKRGADIENAVYGASLWKPKGIVNAKDKLDLLQADAEVPYWSFPWSDLQEMTGGVHRSEIIYLVAGTGVGKSSSFNEFVHHWLLSDEHTEDPAKIGVMAFETLLRDTMMGILSIHANKRLHLDPVLPDEMARLHHEVFGTGRVELFDPETAEWGFEPLISYIRYLVKALDCNIIIVDPLSFIAAQLPENDERRALDKVAVLLSKLAKELNVLFVIAHHLTRPEGVAHEEGGQTSLKHVRGSGGLAMFANGVLGIERNQQAEGEAQLISLVRSLKWRFTGRTGTACYTKYDPETGRTMQIPKSEAIKVLGGKDGGKASSHDHDDNGEY